VFRCNPTFTAFAQRRKANAKPPKVIIVTVAGKFFVVLNADGEDQPRIARC